MIDAGALQSRVEGYKAAERVQPGFALHVMSLHTVFDPKSNSVSVLYPFAGTVIIYVLRTEDVGDDWYKHLSREEFAHVAIHWVSNKKQWGCFPRKFEGGPEFSPSGHDTLESALKEARELISSQALGIRPNLSVAEVAAAIEKVPPLLRTSEWLSIHGSLPETEEGALWILTPPNLLLMIAALAEV